MKTPAFSLPAAASCRLAVAFTVMAAAGALPFPVLAQPSGPGTAGSGQPVYEQWTTWQNRKFAYEVPVPPGLRARTDPNKGGSCRFSSDNGAMVLKAWASPVDRDSADPVEDAFQQALTLAGRHIDFRRRGLTGYILAGHEADGREFYEKLLLGPGATIGFTVSYPAEMADRFAPVVHEIERGFGWSAGSARGAENPQVLAELPARRGGVFSDIRNYFTGENEPPPRPSKSSRWTDPSDDIGDEWEDISPRDRPMGPPPPQTSSSFTPGQQESSGIYRDPSQTKVDLTPPPAPATSSSGQFSTPGREKVGNLPLEKPSVSPIPPAQTGAAGNPAASFSKPQSAVKREDLPFGIVIPGKKGLVYSPFAEGKQQQVDVSGIPTGTKVKCPYTGKVFRVP